MPDHEQMRVCGSCQGWVEVRAVECRHCGAKMKPMMLPAPRPEPEAPTAPLLCPECRSPRKGTGPCLVCAARSEAREVAARVEEATRPPPPPVSPGVRQAMYEPIPGEPTGPFIAWAVLIGCFVLSGALFGANEPSKIAAAAFFAGAASVALTWLVIRGAIMSALAADRRSRGL